MRIGLAQINPVVGDMAGNARLIRARWAEAAAAGAKLTVFPEMVLTGYPPEDLLFKPAFIHENLAELRRLAAAGRGLGAAVVGFVDRTDRGLHNAAAWLEGGRVRAIYHKRCLPNYGVFDEKRYFSPGADPLCLSLAGRRVALSICEDMWIPKEGLAGVPRLRPDIVINLSASPFHAGKLTLRRKAAADAAKFAGAPLLYANLVGGQDELVFDGAGFACDKKGRVTAQAPAFQDGLFLLDLAEDGAKPAGWSSAVVPGRIPAVHDALILGVRDYVEKNGFNAVTVGLSGGMDSALVAAIAVEALGKGRVIGVTMPSRFNSRATQDDAAKVARNLGIRFERLPIEPVYKAFTKALSPLFRGTRPGVAEENTQARIRGTLLMALSNKFGWLVLTTGNKSETSTGYCTLYGDMAGGFAVLKDVLKTTVYEVARDVNRRFGFDAIPESTFTRPPTAELRAGQKDEDSLGPYARLDPLIVDYVEKNMPIKAIARRHRPGGDSYAARIVALIDRNEYKRRQAPPGIKITPRSFGRDHRMPITNRFRQRA